MSSCNHDTTTTDGSTAVHDGNTQSYVTSENLISEFYYENVYRFHRMENAENEDVTSFTRKNLNGNLTAINYSDAKAGRSLMTYSVTGELLGEEALPLSLKANTFAITDDGNIAAAVSAGYGYFNFVLFDMEGNILASSGEYFGTFGTSDGMAAFGSDCILYYSGYTALLFHDLTQPPMELDLPCMPQKIFRLSDDTLLIYGKIDYVLSGEYFLLDTNTGECSEYRYSDTVKDPAELFTDARDTCYGNGEFYANCKDGLYVYRDGAPVLLVNWSESDMDGSAITVEEVFSDDAFLVSRYDELEYQTDFGFLTRTEERRTKPREIVRLAAVGLDNTHRDLIYAAALQFNRENDDYKIILTDYETQAEETVTSGWTTYEEKQAVIAEAAQNAFEADLLAGVTYDGYFLPEVSENRELLSDKGLLCDLSGYLSEGQLLGCIETAYTTDGGIIALPFFMKLTTLITTQNTLPSTTRLTREVLYDLAAGLDDDETLFVEDVYDTLKTVGQYDFIDFDAKTCSFDTGEFAQWLDFLLDVRAGMYTDVSLEVIHGENEDLLGWQTFAMTSLDANRITEQNRVKFTEFTFSSVDSVAAMLLCFKGQRINYCGYPSDDGTTVLLSSDAMFSMSKTAPSPDGAAAFMQYLLSDEIQTCKRMDRFGLPVSRTAMERVFPMGYIYYKVGALNSVLTENDWMTYHPDAFGLSFLYSGDSMSAENQLRNGVVTSVYTRTDDRDLFLRFLDRATVKTAADATLATILDEEISYAEAGVRDSHETGRILQSRVNIYINE